MSPIFTAKGIWCKRLPLQSGQTVSRMYCSISLRIFRIGFQMSLQQVGTTPGKSFLAVDNVFIGPGALQNNI